MGFEAYTTDDQGKQVVRQGVPEWESWVAATRTRNWCKQNALVDWLELYGDDRGFARDREPDPRCDFQAFILRQGQRFEGAVIDHLATIVPVYRLPERVGGTRSPEACRDTFEAMARGEAIISQGVVWSAETLTYGAPDILIRSDILQYLFPGAIDEEEVAIPAPGIAAERWHYRVVDIKFTTLALNSQGRAANGHLPFMVQTFLYNEALARIQGYWPPQSYLLGRGWTKGDDGAADCMDRLAPVPNDCEIGQESLYKIAREAADWVIRLRRDGRSWDPRAALDFPELLPNLGERGYPWSRAVTLLAEERQDPTLAWQVGLRGRQKAFLAGVERWTDPLFTAQVAGLTGERGHRLDRILEVNRRGGDPAVSPPQIESRRDEWITPVGVEFYVDFETVSNLNDDFTRIPEQNGQPLIFMIGCGHVEDGEWMFSCFVADDLTPGSEATIIERWLAHMESVRRRLAPQVESPLVFHWSAAEAVSFSGLKSARQRSPGREAGWMDPHWFDFLQVMRAEPVVVQGPMGFGLKTVAASLKAHGLIETEWKDGVTDGLGAMVAAWWCADQAEANSCRLIDIDLMSEISEYNEIDCKVMQETIAYLRANH